MPGEEEYGPTARDRFPSRSSRVLRPAAPPVLNHLLPRLGQRRREIDRGHADGRTSAAALQYNVR